jgi:hypothetical protein
MAVDKHIPKASSAGTVVVSKWCGKLYPKKNKQCYLVNIDGAGKVKKHDVTV